MEKKFYWLKLKTEFMTGEVVRYLLKQEHGSDFIVIYLQLCTMTVNTEGELATKLGDIVVPFDNEAIRQECKYFDIQTISKAITLFQTLGLIYKQDNGILKIADFENIVGSETYWAKQKRKSRKKEKEDKLLESVQQNVHNPLISKSNSISNSLSSSVKKGSYLEYNIDDSELPFK